MTDINQLTVRLAEGSPNRRVSVLWQGNEAAVAVVEYLDAIVLEQHGHRITVRKEDLRAFIGLLQTEGENRPAFNGFPYTMPGQKTPRVLVDLTPVHDGKPVEFTEYDEEVRRVCSRVHPGSVCATKDADGNWFEFTQKPVPDLSLRAWYASGSAHTGEHVLTGKRIDDDSWINCIVWLTR